MAHISNELQKVLDGAGAQENTRSPAEERRRWPRPCWSEGGFPLRHRQALAGGVDRLEEGFILDWPNQQRATAARDRLLVPGGCLALLGPRGTGKTQMAVELSLYLEKAWAHGDPYGEQVYVYSSLGDLFNSEKRSWDKKGASSPIKRAQECGLLILDEIQEVVGSAWEMAELVRLFDRRYSGMKRTILVGNLDVAGAQEFLGHSIWSRLTECGLIVLCDWDSFRGGRTTGGNEMRPQQAHACPPR